MGLTGDTGPMGSQGPQGEMGPSGVMGLRGEKVRRMSFIEFSGVETDISVTVYQQQPCQCFIHFMNLSNV